MNYNSIFRINTFIKNTGSSIYFCSTFRRGKKPLGILNPTQKRKLAEKFLKKETKIIKNHESSCLKALPSTSSPLKIKDTIVPIKRRLIKLDKIFTEKITEILSTSDYGFQIIDNRIEITKIQCQIGLSSIHIYWTTKNTKLKDEELMSIFNFVSYNLRQSLTCEYIIGRVPPILFIKDTSRNQKELVEKLLYLVSVSNEDNTPHVDTPILEIETIEKKLSSSLWKKLDEKSEELDEFGSTLDDDDDMNNELPTLNQNIFSVRRDQIIARITHSMKTSKGENRAPNFNQKDFIIPVASKMNPNNIIDIRTSDINKWASKYRKMKREKEKGQLDAEIKLYSVFDYNQIEDTNDEDIIGDELDYEDEFDYDDQLK